MAKSAAAQAMEEKNMGSRIVAAPSRLGEFFREVRNEMRHVTSPNRKEVQGTTTVVLITVGLFGLFFLVVDFALDTGMNKLLHYFAR